MVIYKHVHITVRYVLSTVTCLYIQFCISLDSFKQLDFETYYFIINLIFDEL